jgi:peroxiredoxin
MTIAVSERIPSVKFKHIQADGTTVELDTAEVFKGKKMILFGLPGAFTPTCHNQHVPSYVARAEELRAKGIQGVVCMAIGDQWLMRAWADSLGTGDKVMMLADGNGELTRGLGVELDLTGAKMGIRTRRFVAVVNDGVIESIDIEPAGGIEVTGADACLARL